MTNSVTIKDEPIDSEQVCLTFLLSDVAENNYFIVSDRTHSIECMIHCFVLLNDYLFCLD